MRLPPALLAAALASCHAPAGPGTGAPADPAWIEVTRGVHGHVLVPVVVGGVQTRFLVDSGASADLVTPALARILRLAASGSAESVGAGGSAGAVSVTTLPELRVGDDRFAPHPVAVQEFDPDEPTVGGALGRPFFASHDVQVDLRHGRLRLLEAGSSRARPELAPPGYVRVPFESVGGLDAVGVRLDGAEAVPGIVDLGATHSIASLEAAARAGVVIPGGGPTGAVAVGADGRNVPVTTHVFRSLAIGALMVPAPTLAVGDLPVFAQLGLRGPAVVVGLDVLASHDVVFAEADGDILLSAH